MKCPFCGFDNLAGEEECGNCQEPLADLDGVVPRNKLEKSIMEDPIRSVETRGVVSVPPDLTVTAAAQRMIQGKVGCAIVLSGKALQGIVTERDILNKVYGAGRDPARVKVGEIMTPNPETLTESDQIAYALNKMAIGGYRHIPILKEGRVTGLVSIRDLLAYLAKIIPEESIQAE